MKNKKVLQVLNSLGRGGIETFIVSVYQQMDLETVSFDFAIMEGKATDQIAEIQKLGAKVYVYPRLTARTIPAFLAWWKAFFKKHKGEYQVVHGHVFTSAALYLPLAKKAGCYTIVHSHSTRIAREGRSKLEMWARQLLLKPLKTSRWIDKRLACSVDAGRWLFGPNSDFEVIKNGIQIPRFRFEFQTRQRIRANLGVKEGEWLIGHVGNGTEAKNHLFLLAAFAEFHKAHPSSKLVLVGDLSRLQTVIRDFVVTHDLTDCVNVIGIRSDVPQLMMAMDLFVFPSTYEGLGIVLIEAQCWGLPCLASDVTPKEAKVSDWYWEKPLQHTPKQWAQTMADLLNNATIMREDAWQQVKASGYDVQDAMVRLRQLYCTGE